MCILQITSVEEIKRRMKEEFSYLAIDDRGLNQDISLARALYKHLFTL